MRGQSSTEFLILVAGILLTATSLLYLGLENNELSTVLQAARDGTENAIATIEIKYECSVNIDNLSFDEGNIIISVILRSAAPENNCEIDLRDNFIKGTIKGCALNYIQNAISGHVSITSPIKTAFHTYNVLVNIKEVTK